MIGKITPDGRLHIQRGNTMKSQLCYRAHSSFCGDTCPLFGEPRTTHDEAIITICEDRELRFESFTDERRHA